MTPSHGPGHRKWCKMADVNGACKQSRYEHIWLKSLSVMSNMKPFAIKDGWLGTTDYMIHNYVTHIDQK